MMEEIILIEYIPLNADRITDIVSYGIQVGAIAIISMGLVGFTINKFINLMKG